MNRVFIDDPIKRHGKKTGGDETQLPHDTNIRFESGKAVFVVKLNDDGDLVVRKVESTYLLDTISIEPHSTNQITIK